MCGVWCVVCGVCVVGPSQPGHATRDTAISRASTLHCELRRSLRLPPLCHRCRESNPAAQGFWASAARRRPRLVSERFPLTPLQYWLFTPGMQWQSRGQMVYLTGVSTGNARGRHGILRGSGELAAGGETLPSAQRDHAFPLFRVRTAEPWWCVLLPLYAYACAYACAYASAYAYASASALSAWDCTAETGLMMCGVWVLCGCLPTAALPTGPFSESQIRYMAADTYARPPAYVPGYTVGQALQGHAAEQSQSQSQEDKPHCCVQ